VFSFPQVVIIQIDGPKRHVYIKLSDPQLLTSTTRHAEYWDTSGVISKGRIDTVRLGLRKVRIANLPHEVAERHIRMAFPKYGDVCDIQSDTWSNNYRYPVAKGIRIAPINLIQHIPSHLILAGHINDV
jgi:hypothetical protein